MSRYLISPAIVVSYKILYHFVAKIHTMVSKITSHSNSVLIECLANFYLFRCDGSAGDHETHWDSDAIP